MRVLAPLRLACSAVSVGVLLAFPGAALADTDIAAFGDTLFISSDGANNSSELKVVGGKYRYVDDGSTLVPGVGCQREPPADAHVVDCTGLLFKAVIGLGDGKDDVTPASYIELDLTVTGEGGRDQITGGLGNDTLYGNAGDDYTDGAGGNDYIGDGQAGVLGGGPGSGNDQMFGSAGNDVLDGGDPASNPGSGSGADTLGGGTGTDTADYSKRTAPLRLSEGDGANDGQDTGGGPGSEGDNLGDAEIVVGGSGADSITGAGGPNTLRGGDGDDGLDGGLGADLLDGGRGSDTAGYGTRTQPVKVTLDETANDGEANENDTIDRSTENVDGGGVGDELRGDGGANRLRGGGGPDALFGDGGDDRLEGGAEGDGIDGGSGADSIDGGDGDDTVAARDDAKDTIACGAGSADKVVADPFDDVAADCESVDRGSVTQPGGGTDPDQTTLAPLALPSKIKVARNGVAKVVVTCPAAALGGCAKGVLSALNGTKKLAKSKFSLAAGDRVTVVLKFSRRSLTAMRKLKRLTLSATATGAAPLTRSAKLKR